jgi:hypothetical protein
MPAFLQSDDDEAVGYGEGLLAGINTRRRRRQYDERMDEDDVEEDVSAKFYFADRRNSHSSSWATSRRRA